MYKSDNSSSFSAVTVPFFKAMALCLTVMAHLRGERQNIEAVKALENKQPRTACTIAVAHKKGHGKSSGLCLER